MEYYSRRWDDIWTPTCPSLFWLVHNHPNRKIEWRRLLFVLLSISNPNSHNMHIISGYILSCLHSYILKHNNLHVLFHVNFTSRTLATIPPHPSIITALYILLSCPSPSQLPLPPSSLFSFWELRPLSFIVLLFRSQNWLLIKDHVYCFTVPLIIYIESTSETKT